MPYEHGAPKTRWFGGLNASGKSDCMLLYFDNLITDEPLIKGVYPTLNKVRTGCEAYRMPSKFDIAKYTLASYAKLEWSAVIIKYELGEKGRTEEFEKFVKSLFPNAVIIRGRSDNQGKFQEAVNLIKTMQDEWIFYAGNTDHPFVAKDTECLEACLRKAQELAKQHRYVSVLYSHFGEACAHLDPKSVLYNYKTSFLEDAKMMEDNDYCKVVLCPHGDFSAVQVVNRNMLEQWFCSKDLGERRIIRSEHVGGLVEMEDQVIVVPKSEMCAHFDGYSHIAIYLPEDPDDTYPPLFIPEGFFEGKMKIAYGYDKYRKGWVNINPMKKSYSFRDSINGTDLKIGIEDVPLFWKGRIETVDVNPDIDKTMMEATILAELARRAAPWPRGSMIDFIVLRTKYYSRLAGRYTADPEALSRVIGNSPEGRKKEMTKLFHAAILVPHKLGMIKKKTPGANEKR